MAGAPATVRRDGGSSTVRSISGMGRRLATETKHALKTTELYAYIVTFALILIAGNSIEKSEGGSDYFAADKVWLYVTILTVGYMVSRGLSKAGSNEPYWQDSGQNQARDDDGGSDRT